MSAASSPMKSPASSPAKSPTASANNASNSTATNNANTSRYSRLFVFLACVISFLTGFCCAKGMDYMNPIMMATMWAAGGESERKIVITIGGTPAAAAATAAATDDLEKAATVDLGSDATTAIKAVSGRERLKEQPRASLQSLPSLRGADSAGVAVTDDANEGSATAIATSATTSSLSSESCFDKIFQFSYQKATNFQDLLRDGVVHRNNQFDIDFWVNESKLTTTGGLGNQDRILLAQLYGKAESVFEYGLGESTYLANYLGVPRYAGIDSDAAWVKMARDKVAAHFRFYFADVGGTKAWGMPANDLRKNVLDYQLAPLQVEQYPFDVYMVDGRWRLASALACFLHASARGAPHNHTTVLIHDCPQKPTTHKHQRGIYKAADHLLEMINHSGGLLCVYKRKPDTTDQQLLEAWHKHYDNTARV